MARGHHDGSRPVFHRRSPTTARWHFPQHGLPVASKRQAAERRCRMPAVHCSDGDCGSHRRVDHGQEPQPDSARARRADQGDLHQPASKHDGTPENAGRVSDAHGRAKFGTRGSCQRAAARHSVSRWYGVTPQVGRGEGSLVVTQKRLFFVDGRIAKRPLCAARMERAS